ncbi:hypothetical protein EG68_05234 [Paragonimus skrjabini miyazakii]|uniref:Transmembrane protein n=1 Tax=Paragonimus skrjabini miyazakii TaxID=59628 RepID=A0A8S9YTU5_9TREM|nr:hypothetical protein EG68_05234 [Paragonimus skrjabini miyazakii]
MSNPKDYLPTVKRGRIMQVKIMDKSEVLNYNQINPKVRARVNLIEWSARFICKMSQKTLWSNWPNEYSNQIPGICGALALLASAYGAYGLASSESKYKRIFQMGAHYQLVHAIALLGVPLSKYPTLTTSLFLTGTVMLCGSCYYTSLTRSEKPLKVSSAGALSLLLAWLSFAL